jgi:hypothetical protein
LSRSIIHVSCLIEPYLVSALPSAMLVGALPKGLPPQQTGPTFAPPLAHLPPVAWTPWMTPDALTHSLPPQQAALTFTKPLEHPP